MEKKTDLRIQKTHLALTRSFLNLLEEKNFDRITVGEICDAAMVRRATFYKHFADKYEFFTYVIRQAKENFRKKNCDHSPIRTPEEPYIQISRNIMEFLDESGLRVRSVMESDAFPLLLDILSQELYRDVMEVLRKDERMQELPSASLTLRAQAYTGAIVYMAKWWVLHKDQISKEEALEQVLTLLQKND